MKMLGYLRSNTVAYTFGPTLLAALLSLGCSSRPVAIASPVSPQPLPPDSSVVSSPTPSLEEDTLPAEVMDRVLQTAAQELNYPVGELGILRYSREVWSDGCLGLGTPAEACLFAQVEGWQVEVAYGEESWFYRTDLTADQIRLSTAAHNLPPSIETKLLEIVAREHGLDIAELAIAQAEPRIWDGCLNLPPSEDTPCNDIGLFGWQAVVTNGTQSWVYHSNGDGTMLVFNPTAQAVEY